MMSVTATPTRTGPWPGMPVTDMMPLMPWAIWSIEGRSAYGAVLAEAGDAAIDDARIALLHGFEIDAEALGDAGPHVLDDHVGLFGQPHQDLAALVGLQVQRDGALVAMQVLEVRTIALAHQFVGLGVARRRLDPDHVGAPVRQRAARRRRPARASVRSITLKRDSGRRRVFRVGVVAVAGRLDGLMHDDLLPLEPRLALFHERACRPSRKSSESMQAVPIALIASMSRLVGILQHLRDGDLGGLDRQRRVAGNGARDLHGRVPQFGIGQHAIDEADPQRLGGIDPHARVHDKPRPGRPDQRDQMLEAVIAIGDAELGGGNAELAVLGGDADIRQHRHLHAAAEAEAADAGDGRLRIIRQQRALRGAASWNIPPRPAALWRVFSNWLISAPETNALSPAPTMITTRTSGSSRNSTNALPSPSHISSDMALRFSGLLKVMTPTPSADALQDLAVGIGFSGVVRERLASVGFPSPMFRKSRKGPKLARAKAGRACSLVHQSLTRGCFFALTSSGAISSSIRLTNGTAAMSAIE